MIEGHKWFITNASVADITLVVAETNPEGRPHKHASILIVPAGTPGMEIVRDIGTMAHPDVVEGRPGNHAELLFRNCRVPLDHMIGAPGDGFVLAQQRLGGGRIHHAMRWLGQAQRSLDIMCERAVSRRSHGSCSRSTRWCRTTSRCRTPRSRPPASSRSRPRGRWTSTAPAACAPSSA